MPLRHFTLLEIFSRNTKLCFQYQTNLLSYWLNEKIKLPFPAELPMQNLARAGKHSAGLANFKIYCLSDEQAKALIFTREVGAINNAAYRNLNQVDILTASQGLRQLKENDLLISKNKSTATYYLPSQKFVESLAKEHQLQSKEHQLVGKEHQLSPKEHQLEVSNYANQDLTKLLSKDLQNRLNELGKKAVPYKVRDAILALCKYKEVSSSELATYLKRDKKRLIRKFLTPMIEEGILVYKYPQMPGHPRQAYRLKQSDD